MHYSSIQLTNYRSYSEFSVELSEGVNIVVGPNASGKTNLLESILVASVGSSFRAQDRALIKHGAEWLRVHAVMNDDQKRSVVIKLAEGETTSKEFKIDETTVKRITQNKVIPTVLFEPDHLRMVDGSPERRRDYLDTILGQTLADHKTNLRRYKKALAQRNKLLKSGRPMQRDDVFVWDVQLSEYGAKINQARRELAERINKSASETYSSISGKKTVVEVVYAPGGVVENYATKILKGLESRFETDKQRGFTTIGPHREDLKFFINNNEASVNASRGEERTLVLVCKIIELEIIKETYDQKPIILLDDVFSELDGSRRRALTEYLRDHQTVITTTDADAIVKSFLDDYNVIATG